jgi:GcrA cell cycle regulator
MAGTPWPTAHADRLRELIKEASCSAATLARDLSSEFGTMFTRCMVIAKVHRLKLELPRRPIRSTRAQTLARKRRWYRQRQRERERAAAQAPPPAPPAPPHDTPSCDLFALTSERCRWPVGDPRDAGFGFCGEPAIGCYCARHDALAFNRSGKRGRGLNMQRGRDGSWR